MIRIWDCVVLLAIMGIVQVRLVGLLRFVGSHLSGYLLDMNKLGNDWLIEKKKSRMR